MSSLFEYAETVSYLCESLDTTLELLACVPCGDLHTDARLSLWDDRVVEARDKNAHLLQRSCELLRELRIVEHYGAYSRYGRLDVEACGNHLVAEEGDILDQTVVVLIALAEHLEELDAGTYDGRW